MSPLGLLVFIDEDFAGEHRGVLRKEWGREGDGGTHLLECPRKSPFRASVSNKLNIHKTNGEEKIKSEKYHAVLCNAILHLKALCQVQISPATELLECHLHRKRALGVRVERENGQKIKFAGICLFYVPYAA
jgi:hypothetical protein